MWVDCRLDSFSFNYLLSTCIVNFCDLEKYILNQPLNFIFTENSDVETQVVFCLLRNKFPYHGVVKTSVFPLLGISGWVRNEVGTYVF